MMDSRRAHRADLRVRGVWYADSRANPARQSGPVPNGRTVKPATGATAVQTVHSSHRGSRDSEHVGSAHNGAELELLKAAARQRLATGQGELDLDAGADRSSKNPHCSNLERRVCCRSRINRAPPVSHAYSARRTRQEP